MRYWPQKPPLGVPINWGDPLARGLVGCWLLNEGTGNRVYDLSGNGNTGSLVGDTHFVGGKFGSCLSFDGTGDFVTVQDNATLSIGSSGLTIGTWILPLSLTGYQEIFCKKSEYSIALNGSSLTYADSITWNYGEIGAYGTLILNKWAHILVTESADGTTITFFINGSVVGIKTRAGGSLTHDNYPIEIGGWSSMSRYFTGLIDNPSLSNRALAASEVQQLYMTRFRIFERPTFELWTPAIGVPIKVYSRGDVAALPADDADLENAFTDQEYTDVATDDGTRVAQTATGEYAAFLFKDKHTQQDRIQLTWNGQSDRAPSLSPITLQIYNRTSGLWETVATNSIADANTDLTLEGWIIANLSDYFDANFQIAARVYQEAV